MGAKGKTNNPNGRPVGSFNHKNAHLRHAINEIVNDNLDGLKKDLKNLKPKDRLDSIISLMGFVLPKLQSIEMEFGEGTKSKFEKVVDKLAGVDGED